MLKLNRSIADTNRQSYMRKLACGIRRHQNCRIGPSLERTVETQNNIEVIVDFRDIFVIIVIFIHSWWKLTY